MFISLQCKDFSLQMIFVGSEFLFILKADNLGNKAIGSCMDNQSFFLMTSSVKIYFLAWSDKEMERKWMRLRESTEA